VGICISGRIVRRLVLAESEETTGVGPEREVVRHAAPSYAVMAFLLLVTACETPPDWWVRRGMDAGNEAHGSNRAAIIQALEAGRALSPRASGSQAEPRGEQGEMAVGRGWYSIGQRESETVIPSPQQPVWPQAHIVRPPKAPAAVFSGPTQDQMIQSLHPVPPATTILPSPHPGTRCFPDSFGGQRCFSQP
jgi:hypothetical protein